MNVSELDLSFDFEVTKIERRPAGGTWVLGTLHGHRFEALVFEDHAEVADYELEDSRISKLWVQRIADRRTTYQWDRGLIQPADDQLTQAIVDFLAEGIAEFTFAE